MKKTDFLIQEKIDTQSIDLLDFMFANYDITDLANKIYASKCLRLNTLNLRKNGLSKV